MHHDRETEVNHEQEEVDADLAAETADMKAIKHFNSIALTDCYIDHGITLLLENDDKLETIRILLVKGDDQSLKEAGAMMREAIIDSLVPAFSDY